MTRQSRVARPSQFQGQILLERALFCVGCDLIFTGTPHCPRCTSGEAVYPLSEWVGSLRQSAVAVPHSQLAVDDSLPRDRQQKRPAA